MKIALFCVGTMVFQPGSKINCLHNISKIISHRAFWKSKGVFIHNSDVTVT